MSYKIIDRNKICGKVMKAYLLELQCGLRQNVTNN